MKNGAMLRHGSNFFSVSTAWKYIREIQSRPYHCQITKIVCSYPPLYKERRAKKRHKKTDKPTPKNTTFVRWKKLDS